VPYIDGKRVSNEEWTEREGHGTDLLHTSERGVNPGVPGEPVFDADAPNGDQPGDKPQKKSKSQAAREAAKNDTTGTSATATAVKNSALIEKEAKAAGGKVAKDGNDSIKSSDVSTEDGETSSTQTDKGE
jgi:hypothetical protein